MKTIIMIIAILLAGATGYSQEKQTVTHTQQRTKSVKKYTCPMHPEVIKSKPGKCPKCGMKLVAVKSKKTASTQKANTKL